jgi:UDPglucose 6-dehydrogenase
MKDGALLVVSSQMPVGSTALLEREFQAHAPGRAIGFACIPENLRLGKAIEVFLQPDRVVAGVRDQKSRDVLKAVYSPFTDRLEWMSVESAEVTKHAINSFLATSICFINEIAGICERTGADAAEVERGLKTEHRIGPKAYLHAGAAFAGGTLARDIRFLLSIAGGDSALPLIAGVHASNELQKKWLERRMTEVLGSLAGRRVGILGLTYKPGTDTLRRSAAVETASWLSSEGAMVRAFDPQVRKLPVELDPVMSLCSSPSELMRDSEVLVVMTPWPEFRSLDAATAPGVIFDPGRFLENLFGDRQGTTYYTIGRTN